MIRPADRSARRCGQCWALVVVLFVGMFTTPSAFAFIPSAKRTIKAIAEVNRVSGRTTAIQLDLTMRIGDRSPIATGELISHPSGLARLELRGFGGRIDRYLLSGDELLAAKDGKRLDQPQPMLQPIFLLQPGSETTLRAALDMFGIASQWIGLAPCGDQDCFVIGDPRLAAPLPSEQVEPTDDDLDVLDDPLDQSGSGPTPPVEARSSEAGHSDAEDRLLRGPVLSLPEEGLIPRIWVDTRELQVQRIDRRNGVFIVFGPMQTFGKLTVPAWLEVHEPGAPAIRFDVDRAVQVNAPPQAFSRKWLLAPIDPAPDATPKPANPAGF